MVLLRILLDLVQAGHKGAINNGYVTYTSTVSGTAVTLLVENVRYPIWVNPSCVNPVS